MLSTFEIILSRPRCRNWIPLASQQLRLRHLIRVIAYNVEMTNSHLLLYYTLHSTTMCAPFYTSERLQGPNPKWSELDVDSLDYSAATGVVLRIWNECNTGGGSQDSVLLTWGVHLPGLVYLGTKLTDIQPPSFHPNTIIFQLNGGYFTSCNCVRRTAVLSNPFWQHLNIKSDLIVRYASVQCPKQEIRMSYSVKKLQLLHSLQQRIKNKSLDAQELRDKITIQCGMGDDDDPVRNDDDDDDDDNHTSSVRLLSMTTINRILNKQQQPSRVQRQEIIRLRKLIENARFRTKLLSQERDRKLANLRHLNQQCNTMLDNNEDKNSELMSLYRCLSRDMERLRAWKRSSADVRELHTHTTAQLYLRRKQLIQQMLLIYPIEMNELNRYYTICGVRLPDSESLHSVPENSLSVAFAYVTHVVVMCGAFLQVPLRYRLVHLGSRSKVYDHITNNIPDKEREFPLYTKGKDRLQFHYAVYLLNKNIAQLRWYCGLPTQDLRATLPNLLMLLQQQQPPIMNAEMKRYGSVSTLLLLDEMTTTSPLLLLMQQPISNSCEQIYEKKRILRRSDSGPGLSQILKPVNDRIMIRHYNDGDFSSDNNNNSSSNSSLANSLSDKESVSSNDEITMRTDALVQPNSTFHLLKQHKHNNISDY